MASFDGAVVPLVKQDLLFIHIFSGPHVLDQATNWSSCGSFAEQRFEISMSGLYHFVLFKYFVREK
jgi:hypothetical protein